MLMYKMENKLYTFPGCIECTKVKEILNKKEKFFYQEINAGLGSGRKDFQEFCKNNKNSIEREEGQIILPILYLNSGEIQQGLEKIANSLN